MTTPLRKAAEALLKACEGDSPDSATAWRSLYGAMKDMRAALSQPDEPWSTRRRAAWEDGRRAGIEAAVTEMRENWAATTETLNALRSLAPAPSQQTGGADLMSLARWIVRRADEEEARIKPWPRVWDHACGRCIPGGELVKAGFRCAVHEARDLLAPTPAEQTTPPAASQPERESGEGGT